MHAKKEFIIIIGTIILCKVYCRIGISIYEDLHNQEIGDGLCIKANGSLSPIRKFICEKLNLMYSMRFLSPGTDAHYSIIVIDDEENEGNLKIESTRDCNKDSAYIKPSTEEKKEETAEATPTEEENKEKKKKPTYLEGYHQTLIEMVPSSTGNLSIHTSRADSFIKFLQLEHVSKHKIHILACLFLLAEGVDIPLKVEGSKSSPILVLEEIVIKSEEKNKTEGLKESKPEIKIFSISMKDDIANRKNENGKEATKAVSQKRAADVINFFIENKKNPDIREGGKYAEPKTYEDFKTGKFLNNARWLIQYYIFEYLDSTDSIIELATAVYSMLKKSIQAAKENKEGKEPDHEKVEYLESIINKCFVKSSSANTIKAKHRINILTTIYKESPLANVFPFTGDVSIPGYRAIPSYNRKEDSFNVGKVYSNCVEAGLLSLFCCLAYDPETKEYTTEHMGEVSPDLKGFFDMYNKPLETDTYEMHKDWNKVVGDLENENIRYLKENRNELVSGIINMLYVIAEITGRYSEEEESLKELSILLEEQDNKKQTELFKKVKLYTEKLILSLSKKYSPEEDSELKSRKTMIEILNMSKCLNISGQMELFGEVIVTYSYSDLKDGIELEGAIKLSHTIRHLQTKSFPSQTNTLTNEKKKEISDKKSSIEKEPEQTLTDFLLMHFVEKLIDGGSSISNYYTENIKISRENNYFYPIEKLFLYNTFKGTEYRIDMIYYIRGCLLEHSLEETDPWSRFLSNMIGSLPLEDLNTVQSVFFNPLYRAGLYKSFCTKVNIALPIVDKHIILKDASDCYAGYIYKSNSLCGHLEILKAYLVTKGDKNCFFAVIVLLIRREYTINHLSILTHYGTSIEPLLEIEAFLNSIDRSLPEYEAVIKANDIWLILLNMFFRTYNFESIITQLFDKIVIDEDFVTVEGTKHEYTNENIYAAISKFESGRFPSNAKMHVLSLIGNNIEYGKKLSYLLEKRKVFVRGI
ncbi:hypothetical protein NEIRO03_1473 [Nematocida sp. AWRm78]|nr:hypothetical protein NEIRO02_1675 [Nematocida sp. AWRm79]KAI5184006.1 hypothetical protein NEIRO03_1473 [Nematocida sp. AWRm78]